MYNCHSRKNNKEYWRCHNYSKKVHEQRCRSRCVLEFGKLKSVTGGLHNHPPHTEKIEKIIQRNRLAAVSHGRGGSNKLGRYHSITHHEQEQKPDLLVHHTEHQQHHLLASEAATLHLADHELMHASLMLIHD